MDLIWDKYTRVSRGWRLDPIARVHPRIFLGDANRVDILTFSMFKITHAINCADEYSTMKWFKNKFPNRYECMDAEDSDTFDITSVYPKFEETMNAFLSDPDCINVYVHCQCGINRSAFLLLIYLCKKFRYPMDSAAKNILLQRPCCFLNTRFRKQVVDYIKKLE
jgi:hypothetical protein